MAERGHPLVPLKLITHIISGGTPKADEHNWNGEIPFITPPDLNGLDGAIIEQWERSLTENGARSSALTASSVLLSCRAPIGHIGIAIGEVAFNQGCKAIVPESPDDLRYLAHCLVAFRSGLQAAGRGTTFTELSTIELSSFKIPWPASARRASIADYLDRETDEIDAMLDKMDELSETLRARKAGVASNLYTRGYEQVKLKWLVTEIDDRAGSDHFDLPLLSVSIHYGVQLREESSSSQKASVDLGKYKVARRGQIALNRMRAFQGGLGRVFTDGLVSPDYAVLETIDRVPSAWAEYLMRTPEFIALMTQRLRGIGAADQSNVRTPRINVSDLVELSIPLPDSEEQERVIAELDDVTGKIDAMLAKVAELKSLLIERRAALITDVVTGRKEVA